MGADGSRPRGHDDLRGRAPLTDDAARKLEALDAVVDAQAHTARRQILLTIHFRGSATAGEIAGRFAHKWPTTTRHLRVLERAGLVRQERRGRTRVYTVDQSRIALVSEWLGVPFEAIRFVQGDTDQVPFGRGSFAARASLVGGCSVKMASEAMVEKAKPLAAHRMEAARSDIQC